MNYIETFAILRAVDVSPYVQSKGGLSYLPWAACHQLLMENSCPPILDELDVEYHPDRTATVWCKLTIHGFTVKQGLPVMNYKNDAIVEPDARDINDNRQRCFVKAAGRFGLGLGLYMGEVAPENRQDTAAALVRMNAVLRDYIAEVADFKAALRCYLTDNTLESLHEAVQTYYDAGEQFQKLLAVATTKGGPLTVEERAVIKSDAWHAARKEVFDNA